MDYQARLRAEIAKIVTRETHKGSVNRVRIQLEEAITALFLESVGEDIKPEDIQLYPPGTSADYKRYCDGFNGRAYELKGKWQTNQEGE